MYCTVQQSGYFHAESQVLPPHVILSFIATFLSNLQVLRHPVDDLDPVMQNDFDREVKFMRSCRHPHVLTFYGAGIDTDHRAFLVTELMSCSLKPMLRDRKRPLDWATRITFTVDIAKGMQCKPRSTSS